MSHQVITRMAYNAKTKQIETWQHSNNVWPTTDHFYALDVKTDEQMFEFITLIANGLWQGRKWRKAFKTLFEEYPELVRSSYEHELRGQPWKAYCAICKKYEELAKKVLQWTIRNMQDKKGYFYYQLKPGISSKISYMRWSNAFMFNAMSHYLLAI